MVWRGQPQAGPSEAGGPSTARGQGRNWTQNRRQGTTLIRWVWLLGRNGGAFLHRAFVCLFCFHPSGLKRWNHSASRKQRIVPEVLCAVLVREPLWLEARMDDQALLEGIVVFSDEDGPGRKRKKKS